MEEEARHLESGLQPDIPRSLASRVEHQHAAQICLARSARDDMLASFLRNRKGRRRLLAVSAVPSYVLPMTPSSRPTPQEC